MMPDDSSYDELVTLIVWPKLSIKDDVFSPAIVQIAIK